MIIDGREIGPHKPPYVIAEVSCNHAGNFDTACKLIKAAKGAGADAVKFQAYTADTITLNHNSDDFFIKDGPWKGQTLHDLYRKTQTPFEWFPELFKCAREVGITIFASVFDKSSIDMLEGLGCPAYKIASMEITDLPLIGHAAETGKPLIISTGMATDLEIEATSIKAGPNKAFLACTSSYPASLAASNLRLLEILKEYYRVAGISDHTLGHIIPCAATAMGASLIEKHLMMGDEWTEDYEFSLDPTSFKVMVHTVNKIWKALQPKEHDAEASTRQLRRSLYVVKDIKAGEPFTEENVRSIRPAYGLAPGKLPWLLTKIAAADLPRGTALKEDHIADTLLQTGS